MQKAVLLGAAFLLSSCQSKPKVSTELGTVCEESQSAICALENWPASLQHPLSILQGVTSPSQTTFSIVAPRSAQLEYWLIDSGKKTVLTSNKVMPPGSSDWRVDTLLVKDLKLGVRYELMVVNDGRLWDRRGFTTLDLNQDRLHFAIASCMDDIYWQAQSMAWQKVRETHPQLLFLIGDNVYGNKYVKNRESVTPLELWQRYLQMRQTLDLYRWSQLVPVIATWDDHDYGANDGDRSYVFKNESTAIFNAFFPQSTAIENWTKGPGIASYLKTKGQDFVLLDDRSFRSPNKQIGDDQTQFGADQEKWLYQIIKDSKNPIWIMNGGQFFGGYHSFESYEGSHPTSFQKFTNRLKNLRHAIVFVSGDRHMSELMKISKKDVGIDTYELTSSGMHARTFPDSVKMNPNPRRIEASSGPMNFMEIDSTGGQDLRFSVKAWNINGDLLYQRRLNVGRRYK